MFTSKCCFRQLPWEISGWHIPGSSLGHLAIRLKDPSSLGLLPLAACGVDVLTVVPRMQGRGWNSQLLLQPEPRRNPTVFRYDSPMSTMGDDLAARQPAKQLELVVRQPRNGLDMADPTATTVGGKDEPTDRQEEIQVLIMCKQHAPAMLCPVRQHKSDIVCFQAKPWLVSLTPVKPFLLYVDSSATRYAPSNGKGAHCKRGNAGESRILLA